jgi:hypothetical protein
MRDHSEIKELKEWLRETLGGCFSLPRIYIFIFFIFLSVSCDLLLSKLYSSLKNKHYLNLKLLRIDSELSCGDLVDGRALNIYAAQAIIDFLNFERLAKKKSDPSPAPSPHQNVAVIVNLLHPAGEGIREIKEGVERLGEGVDRLGGGMDRIEARVNDETPLSDLYQGIVTEFRNTDRK